MEKRAMIGRFASKLLSLDTVFRGVQSALKKSLDARRTMERNIERVLAGANLPSARDVERVLIQVKELDRDLGEIARRVEAVSEKLEKKPRRE
jgi:hypothetical protein